MRVAILIEKEKGILAYLKFELGWKSYRRVSGKMKLSILHRDS